MLTLKISALLPVSPGISLAPLSNLGAHNLMEVVDDRQDILQLPQLLLYLSPLKFEGLKLIRKLLGRWEN